MRTGAPTALAQALRIHGCLHGDPEALAASAQAAAETPDGLEYARSLTELGAMQAAAGQREDARETLRAALATAHEAGAITLAGRARAELIAAGGRPRRPAMKGVAALTPTELQVARLGAGGLSNRDIADTLFVSLKTVEQHLARSYAKLQIAGRGELDDGTAGLTTGPKTGSRGQKTWVTRRPRGRYSTCRRGKATGRGPPGAVPQGARSGSTGWAGTKE